MSQPAPKGGTLDCTLYQHAPSLDGVENPPLASADLQEDYYYWLTCTDASGEQVVARFFQYEPGVNVIDPAELARRARDQLDIRYPEPRTSPAFTIDQIVGIDTWLWIDPAAWEPISATASIPGLAVSATATPHHVTWDLGDGTTVTCHGPGTPYDDSRPPSEQSTDCSHLYQDAGAHTASATITWTVEWSATDGTGGPLADANRTTEFPMTVVERQAVGT
ncbi:MAG: hypothetical protein U5K30_05945 [Acidimicrobiales bacterium]|nr:hypothetical protein [Acidimicrobiales bacterium]